MLNVINTIKIASKLPWQLLQDFMQFCTIHPVFLIHSPDDAHNRQAALLSMHDETDKTR